MKISEVTLSTLKEYLKVDYDDDDKLLEEILKAGIQYIKDYTGASEETLNNSESFFIALLVLCSEMYETRTYIVTSGSTANKVVKGILDMNSFNLL